MANLLKIIRFGVRAGVGAGAGVIPIIPIDHLVSIKRLIISIDLGSGLFSPILQTKNKIKEFSN